MMKPELKVQSVTPGNAQHVGARSEQQDSFGFSDFDDLEFVAHAGVLAIVADGMGGMAMGRESSATAVQTFLSSYAEKEPEEKIAAAMDHSLHAANRAVNRKAAEAGVEGEAGTTLVAVVIHDGLLYRIGAGDSRIYLYRDGSLRQLTTDYNYGRVLDRMVEKGEISADEAESHPSRAALTSYLGKAEIDEYDLPSDPPLKLNPGDKVLLASDGLFGFIAEEEIIRHLAKDPQHAAEAMVHATVDQQKPYQDNVTVAILGYELAPPTPLADTQLRKSEPPLPEEKKTGKKKKGRFFFKAALFLIVLAVLAFWGGRNFADIADKADNGKPTEKISEKKTDQPETKPPEKSVDKPQDNKNAPTGMKP